MLTGSSAPKREERPAREVGDGVQSGDNLALLYQGLFTGIVRLQARRQQIPDAEVFRKRTKATLQEIEQLAAAGGYDGRDVRDTHFAIVAFLDSVVLHLSDPIRAEWERKTLQQELFGQTDAGVVFFEKLDQFQARRDSRELADILEVYLLCLLLGFEGRYSGGLRGELESIINRLQARIEHIRGRSRALSPSAALPLRPEATPVPSRRSIDYRLMALAAIVFTILCFLILKLNLIWASEPLLYVS
jgi:type VI secretion system protein ImpK